MAGLRGEVVLELNDDEPLTVSDNGGFVFETKLDDGAAYEVTVHTQPASQTCTIQNASGTVARANVADIAVT